MDTCELKVIRCSKILIATTLVNFGISSLCGSLLLDDLYFRRVVTFGEQKTLYKVGATELFFQNERLKFAKSSKTEMKVLVPVSCCCHIARLSHQYGPSSIPGLGAIYGLNLLLLFVLAPRRFPHSSKTNISKFQFDPESEGHRFVSRLPPSLNKVVLFVLFSFFL